MMTIFLFTEICLLTNAKRVASVRSETYCNLFSLSVNHFTSVLEHYPVMRRTMESVAAERLNKIGKNPSLVSNRAELEDDINTVNEIIMQTTPLASSGSDVSLIDMGGVTGIDDVVINNDQIQKHMYSESYPTDEPIKQQPTSRLNDNLTGSYVENELEDTPMIPMKRSTSSNINMSTCTRRSNSTSSSHHGSIGRLSVGGLPDHVVMKKSRSDSFVGHNDRDDRESLV